MDINWIITIAICSGIAFLIFNGLMMYYAEKSYRNTYKSMIYMFISLAISLTLFPS